MHIKAIGVAVCARLSIVLLIIAGYFILSIDDIKPRTIPIIIGFFNILTNAFFILLPFPALTASLLSAGCALNVSTTTANILNNGTAATIISGAIPVSEYIFCTNAIPRIAALLLHEPCTNAPFCVSSFINISVAIHTNENISIVTILQYNTNCGSNLPLKSDFDKSLNSNAGNATLNTYLLATLAKWSSIRPICLINHPIIITRNIGTVALILYIKLSIINLLSTPFYLSSTYI